MLISWSERHKKTPQHCGAVVFFLFLAAVAEYQHYLHFDWTRLSTKQTAPPVPEN